MVTHEPTPLCHRLQQVRKTSGLSHRSISRRTGIPISEVRRQETSNDITAMDLVRWKQALGVPIEELFQPGQEDLANHIRLRAGLIRITRCVKSLLNDDTTESQAATIHNIVHQLSELMPELSEINAWPQYGARRALSEPSALETNVIETSIWCSELSEN